MLSRGCCYKATCPQRVLRTRCGGGRPRHPRADLAADGRDAPTISVRTGLVRFALLAPTGYQSAPRTDIEQTSPVRLSMARLRLSAVSDGFTYPR